MIKIKYYGHACFELESEGTKLLTDPFQNEIGLTLPEIKADMVLISQNEASYNNSQSIKEDSRIFDWPGEYEMNGVHFKRISSYSKNSDQKTENIISIILFNEFKICHLGGQKEKLNSEILEQIGDVDILFVPVGGNSVFNEKQAKECVEEIEPRLVIPMSYQFEGSKLELAPLDDFLSQMGSVKAETLDELKVKKSELPEDNSKVVVLEI